MRISFHTFGCKSNLYDSNQLASELLKNLVLEIKEHQLVADVHIVNTCTVTSSADSQARNLIRRINEKNDFATIIITGCSVRRNLSEYERLIQTLSRKNNQLIVVKNLSYEILLKTIEKLNLNNKSQKESKINKTNSSVFRTRAFIKVTDGCNNFCSYCIIPLVRGPERSRKLSDILDEVSKLEAEGTKEIVITGINTGNYNMGIENLLKHLLKFTTIPRIRVSSLRPSKITPELINIMQNERICPHFHVSLQSGSDKVLKLMNRLDYNSRDFLDKLKSFYLKTQFRNPFIAADIIVGFPGEDGGNFNETLSILEESPINKLHVFVFSPRPGTKAFTMARGDSKEHRRRRDVLLDFSDRRYLQALKNMVGKEVEILWEKNNIGRTENYYPVSGSAIANTIQRSLVSGVDETSLQLLI